MSRLILLATTVGVAVTTGCQSGGPRMGGLNPFHVAERTSIKVPAERLEAIRAVALQSTGADTPDQRQIVAPLVAGLAAENDPLLREATYETLSAYNVPEARAALVEGLDDNDTYVRRKCCRLLGTGLDSQSTTALARVLREDSNFDVRVAAAKSLGNAPAGRDLLVAALQDRDPALQYVGVEAMKQITGQDYGGDVSAYLALARGETPPPATQGAEVSVATRARGWIPFF